MPLLVIVPDIEAIKMIDPPFPASRIANAACWATSMEPRTLTSTATRMAWSVVGILRTSHRLEKRTHRLSGNQPVAKTSHRRVSFSSRTQKRRIKRRPTAECSNADFRCWIPAALRTMEMVAPTPCATALISSKVLETEASSVMLLLSTMLTRKHVQAKECQLGKREREGQTVSQRHLL